MNEEHRHVTANGERSVAIGGDVRDSIIATGDYITIIVNKYISGVTELVTDFASRIKNFFREYLGTSNQPVPFGGREKYLAYLDSWLENGPTPYLLLAAPAGRGKSALLVYWSQRLLARDDLAIAFVPVSIRFSTNLASVFFVALTARLAKLHGEKVPANPGMSPENWRGLMSDYLNRPLPDGRRLLLIVDGLDEAGWRVGPDLFPFDPPKGLRIILSARYLAGDTAAEGWMRRLGWDHGGLADSFVLDPLSAEGITEVLQLMYFPLDRVGEAQQNIAPELYRLSKGDPLLVRLYVDALRSRTDAAAHLNSEELRNIQPGLKGYFDRWWAEQRQLWGDQAPLREPAVQALLDVLACALGPLSTEDVLRLVPKESRLNSWMLEEALSPLNRFVIGDGKQQNFVFSHPRLGLYFYERLSEWERQTVESRFLDVGRKVCAALNEGKLSPEQASSYFVQYYGAHLERAGQNTEALLLLVSDGWRQAWVALEGTHVGFLNDVGKAWNAVEQDDEKAIVGRNAAPYVGSEVRCALCQASINSLAINIPPPLLPALVKSEIWTPVQGMAYARQVPDSTQRAAALVALIPILSESKPLLQVILETALTIDDNVGRVQVLAELTPHLSKQQREEALQIALASAEAIPYEKWRAQAMEALIPYLSGPLLERALEAILRLEDETIQAMMLAKLIPHLPDQRKEEALVSLRAIESVIDQVEVIIVLSPYLSEQQKNELAQEMLWKVLSTEDWQWGTETLSAVITLLPEQQKDEVVLKAFEITRTLVDEDFQPKSLVALAPFLSLSLLQEVLKIVLAAKYEVFRWALAKLIPYFPDHLKEEVMQEAWKAIRTLKFKADQAETLLSMIPFLPEQPKSEAVHDTLRIAWEIEDDGDRTLVLISLLPYLTEQQKSEIVEKTLEAAPTLSQPVRAAVLENLIPHLSEPSLQKALVTVQTFVSREYISTTLGILAPYLSRSLLHEALKIASMIKDDETRARVLAELIVYLPEHQKDEVLRGALEVARMTINDGSRARSLVDLFPHLLEPLRQDVLKTIRMMKDTTFRAWALAKLSSSLTDPLKSEVVQEALEATCTMKGGSAHEEWKVWILSALASNLSSHLFLQARRIALGMEIPEYRVKALANLASHAPKEQKDKAVQEALSETGRLLEKYQAALLVELVPHLSIELRDQVVREALWKTDRMKSEAERIHVLAKVAPYLPSWSELWIWDWLGSAIVRMEVEKQYESLIEILAVLAPYLSEPLLNYVLECSQRIKDDIIRLCALTVLTPYLPEQRKSEVAQEVLKDVETVVVGEDQTEFLAYLAPYLPEPLVHMALEGISKLKRSSDQRKVLVRLVPRLSDRLLQKALLITQRSSYGEERTEGLSVLTSRLTELHPMALYTLWRARLHFSAQHSRQDLIAEFVALAPIISKLGGSDALVETCHAILEVGQWWP